MTSPVKIARAEGRRALQRAGASSGMRGRSLASLVQRIEQRDPSLAETVGVSSSAMRAGELVRDMRRSIGLSQTELAARLGVSQARVSEIESGAGTQGPTWELMERIAAACGQEVGVVRKGAVASAAGEDLLNLAAQALRNLISAGAKAALQKVTPVMVDAVSARLGATAEPVRAGGQSFIVLDVNAPKSSERVKMIVEPLAIAGPPAAVRSIARAGAKKPASG